MATHAPDSFAVEDLQRVGPDLWKGDVTCAFEEALSGIEVAHVCRVTVRFTFPEDGSAKELLEAAKEKAVESLADAAELLRQHSAAELTDAALESIRAMTPEELTAEIARRMDEQN